MTYKHLSQAERYQIYVLMKAGRDQSQIAKLLDRHKSTISWELSRNSGSRGYHHDFSSKAFDRRESLWQMVGFIAHDHAYAKW